MIMTQKIFDYIIYPANLLGCVIAIKKAQAGSSVLLMNNYGFAGGDLTHSLACYQYIEKENSSTITQDIFNRIISKRNSVFYNKDKNFVLNPESIKIAFQEILEENGIEVLFHVLPISIQQEEEIKNVFLSAREGTIVKKSLNVIDTSENYSLLRFVDSKKKLVKCSFNIFICQSSSQKSVDFKKIISHNLIEKYVLLDDNRYWISLKIPIENELFIENKAQEILNKFESFVLENGGRIQLVAPQTQKIYQLENFSSENKIVFHPKEKMTKKLSETEIFLESSYIEKEMIESYVK